jgi:hypothetical protein
LPFFESSRRRPRQEKSTFRVLKSQTTNWGSCSYFLFWKTERPPPFSLVSFLSRARSNALTREFNQLDERTHSSTTKRESALGSPLKSPTTNEQIQARDTSEESSELRQQLRFVGPGNAIFPGLSIEIYLRRPENFHLFPSLEMLC